MSRGRHDLRQGRQSKGIPFNVLPQDAMEGYEPLLFLAEPTGELPVKGENEVLFGGPLS